MPIDWVWEMNYQEFVDSDRDRKPCGDIVTLCQLSTEDGIDNLEQVSIHTIRKILSKVHYYNHIENTISYFNIIGFQIFINAVGRLI